MVFDIARFKIRITRQKSTPFIFSDQFLKAADAYRARGPSRIDFAITIVPYNSLSISSHKFVRRQRHSYYEKDRDFIIKSRYAAARIDTAAKKISIGFKFKNTGKKNNIILLSFVRLAASVSAVLSGGLPFHCAAVCLDNKGIALSGPSGSGKSTIAKLVAPPARLLNDDFNLVLPFRKNTYRIYSTPFTQPTMAQRCVRGSALLGTIFFIEKGPATRIENISFKSSYLLLLGQTYLFPLSDFFGTKVLDNAERICRNVLCKRLHFKKDGSVRLFLTRYAKGLT